MSLSQNSFSFLSNPTGTIKVLDPHRPVIAIGEFFGVKGESHIIGETHGADLGCEYRFQGYSTVALLRAAEQSLEAKYGKLTGTLTETIGGNDRSFGQCTFLTFQSIEAPFLDGSGVYGWVMRGFLLWRQRKRG